MSSFVSKVELKYQLKKMGINVIKGNYVRKSDITNCLANTEYKSEDGYQICASVQPLINKLKKVFKTTNWSDYACEEDDLDDPDSDYYESQDVDTNTHETNFKKFISDITKRLKIIDNKYLVLYRMISLSNKTKWLENLEKGYEDIDSSSHDSRKLDWHDLQEGNYGQSHCYVGTYWSYDSIFIFDLLSSLMQLRLFWKNYL